MQNFKKTITILFVLGFISSCNVKEYLGKNAHYSFQAGVNKGGITNNTDLSVVPGVIPSSESTIDAFTGATFHGFNAGAQVNFPVKRNSIQSGIHYMLNRQRFTFADEGNRFVGTRHFEVSQVQLPLTWNFSLLKNTLPKQQIQLRVGYLGQINLVSVSSVGILPEYTLKPWSGGATMGLTFYPVTFNNGHKLGLFIDAYRGSAVYHDHYNQDTFEMPGSSFWKAGFLYQIK